MSQAIILNGVGKQFRCYHPSRPFTIPAGLEQLNR